MISSTQFLPNKISAFACPAGNASCALNYSPGNTALSAPERRFFGRFLPKSAWGGKRGSLVIVPVFFFPAEIPGPESYREPRGPGCSTNGHWRGLAPPPGSVPQKPRLSRSSYLDGRKTPGCVRPPPHVGFTPRTPGSEFGAGNLSRGSRSVGSGGAFWGL